MSTANDFVIENGVLKKYVGLWRGSESHPEVPLANGTDSTLTPYLQLSISIRNK